MGQQQNVENARAAREAREALGHRTSRKAPLAVDAALRKYLAAERYVEHASHEAVEEPGVPSDTSTDIDRPD